MFYVKSDENIILIIYATLRVPNVVRHLLLKISLDFVGWYDFYAYLCRVKSGKKKVLIIYATLRVPNVVRHLLFNGTAWVRGWAGEGGSLFLD